MPKLHYIDESNPHCIDASKPHCIDASQSMHAGDAADVFLIMKA